MFLRTGIYFNSIKFGYSLKPWYGTWGQSVLYRGTLYKGTFSKMNRQVINKYLISINI